MKKNKKYNASTEARLQAMKDIAEDLAGVKSVIIISSKQLKIRRITLIEEWETPTLLLTL